MSTDTSPLPRWHGTARGYRGPRKVKGAKPAKPARPAPRVFSEQQDPQTALDASSWAGTGEGRGENGMFAVGNSCATPDPARIAAGVRIKRRFKQLIDDEHPTLLADAVKELAHIALEGETHGDRLKAIQLLMDRYWGKLREHKTINKIGGSTQNISVAMFGLQGAALLDAVKTPEDRYRLAAVIDQMEQLEHSEGSTDGQESIVEGGTGPDILVSRGDGA